MAPTIFSYIVGLLLVIRLPSVQNLHPPGFASAHQPKVVKAVVTGTVSIPVISRQQRVFRGRAYRRRGSISGSNDGHETTQERQPYLNTIISAHPLSFETEIEPLDIPARIEQENAVFIPHVTPVTVGSIVQFVNNDPFFHNVFSLTPGARFTIGRRPTGDVYSKEIPRVEEVRITGLGEIQLFCDIHPGMNAVILSLDTPYFTRVNEDGSFTLEGLPSGRYELRAYNPRFDILITEISIEENSTIQYNFNFSS